VHQWEGLTPTEEVLRGLDDLVRQGKVLYLGLSDIPAWQASRMQAIADLRSCTPFVALQPEYSQVERTPERDLIPMSREMGLGFLPWAPLTNGVLSGKYSRADLGARQEGLQRHGARKAIAGAHGSLSERSLKIADVVAEVAKETGRSSAQVALAWLFTQCGVTAPLLGARTLIQLENNLSAFDVSFSDDQLKRLDAASAIELGFPHTFLREPFVQQVVTGGTR
jgi:aryl-alcohol dehydrogenase-like predicted oxidoreductase